MTTRTTTCTYRDDLAIQCLLAFDELQEARKQANWAVTQTQQECAATRLRRVEEYWNSSAQELAGHCEQHQCTIEEIADLLEYRPMLREAC